MAGLRYPVSADISSFQNAMKQAGDIVVSQAAGMVQRFGAVSGSATKIGAAMADAQAKVAAHALAMTRDLGKVALAATGVQDAMSKIGNVARGAATAAVLYIGLKNIFEGIEAAAKLAAETVEKLAEIGQKATDLNVSTSFLQSLTNQAKELGIEAKTLEDALRRVREVSIVKQGSGGEDARNDSDLGARLRRQAELGNVRGSDVTAFAAAADTEARFKMLLELMQRLMSEGRELAALDIGSKFLDPGTLDRIRQNRAELDKLIEATRNLKPAEVFSQGDIERSQELARRMGVAKETLTNGLKPIYEDLGLLSMSFHRSNVEWVEFLARQVPTIIGLYRNVADTVVSIATAYDRVFQSANRLGLQINKSLGGSGGGPAAQNAGATPTSAYDPDMAAARARLTRDINPFSISRQQREGQAIAAATSDLSRGGDKTKPDARKAAGSSPSESLDEIERYINQIQRSGEVLKAEFEALGKSNVEREKGIALARLNAAARAAGRDVTEEERQKVLGLAEANATLSDKLADQRQRLQENAELMRTFGQAASDAFAGMVLDGKKFDAVLSDLTRSIARMLIQAAFTGQGPLAGLGFSAPASAGPNAVGGLVGLVGSLIPKFADGTNYAPGGMALVGERGPELVNLPRGSQVIPNSGLAPLRMPQIGDVKARSTNVNVSSGDINVTVSGNGVTHGEVVGIVRRAFGEQQHVIGKQVRAALQRGQ